MKIAICDNDSIIVSKIVSLLEDYIYDRGYDATYETFGSYESLVEKVDGFDLFLLDHNMNDDAVNPEDSSLITGMDFAKHIRKVGGELKGIIFLTSYRDLIYTAQSVDFTRFICKPIEKDALYGVLDAYFSSKKKSGRILVRIGNDTHFINIEDILYLEVIHKDITVYTEDSAVTCHKSITDFENELNDYGFFRPHRSYLVNIKKIKQLNSRNIIMVNDDEIPLSKKNYSELLNRFIELNQG